MANVSFDDIAASIGDFEADDPAAIAGAIEELGSQITEALARASRLAAQNAAKEFAQAWATVARRIAAEWRETLPTLAACGWYLDGGMAPSAVKSIVQIIKKGDIAYADALFVKYFNDNAVRIKSELFAAFPHRRSLLRGAFAAHRERRYSLAIPIMLAQADGICADEFGLSLFMSRERLRMREKLVGLDEETDAVIAPLLSLEHLTADTRKHPLPRGAFNRHGILHGVVLDYGTRQNSCRAISFLGYINVIIRRWRRSASRRRRLTPH